VLLQEQESLKAQISHYTTFQQRKGITGESKLKINSNLNNKIISKPVNSKDFKKINEKSNSSLLNNRIISCSIPRQDQKNLVGKICK
jgi:hypothetical protein